MSAPEVILNLVDRFHDNIEDYRAGKYNETQLRREFLDPFFEALGWDIDNKQGYAEAYKDVIHEDALKISGGGTKAPDYAFCIGGVRKFFLEAKKPSVNIKEDIGPAYQLRRYAWSAKLPLSILTDFEEFAVYDCRIMPQPGDKASNARTMYFTFRQYSERWDEIAAIFSRNAVLKGSFDKYAEDAKRKRGTAEVDDAFLQEIESWREALARNIALRNPGLSVRELNTAVQVTIDRIIFLRIAEDRRIEPYGRLRALQDGKDVYKRLGEFFLQADARYNSGLFHFRPGDGSSETLDTFTLNLALDDKVLKDIFRTIYYPESPYEFSVLPADILGQVYEQFLGKVIRFSGKRVVVEEKPEVKKAGGVYYTPTYVVNFIVENTIRPFLEGKTPTQISGLDKRVKNATPLRILDPACGSGSFLIQAYQFLLNWYRDQYITAGPEKYTKGKNPELYQGAGGEWRLTIAERRRILLTHIYGVDIDPQAVEVTKLSLLLKVLEGESGDAIARQMDFFKVRVLPDLGHNIRCGNSLISSDFYDDFQISMFDEDARLKINVFDWEVDFSHILNKGGFDVVIGNPPYLYSAGQHYAVYFQNHYKYSQYQTDFYVYFIERGISILKENGIISYIVPDSWLNSENFSVMRNSLLSQSMLEKICVFQYQVFKKATIENSIFIVRRTKPAKSIQVVSFLEPGKCNEVNRLDISDIERLGIIDPFYSPLDETIIQKMDKFPTLDREFDLNRGIHAYRIDGYGKSKFGPGPQTEKDREGRSYHASGKLDETYLPEIRGRDVFWLDYQTSGEFISYGEWLAEPREPKFFKKPKIVVRKILGNVLSGAFIEEQAAIDQSLYIIISRNNKNDDLKYALGILLSAIGAWYLRTKYSIHDILYPWYTKKQLSKFPLPRTDEKIISIVNDMIKMVQRRHNSKTDYDRRVINKEISILASQLNKRVFELYGLSNDERSHIEARAETELRVC